MKEMVGKALKGQQGVLTLVGWNVTLSSGLTQSLRAPLPQLTITYGDRQDSWQLQEGDIESEVSPERVVHLSEISAFLALL
ncbi:hypothetical protein ACFOLM_24785 [Deinococcus soli (ex Cha et al. 2016)]|uniref:hypothetical protein n=1 Tax=Deinococcus soli (ex Cha et al. 2016) TaxID=1309411 RepID=UPI00361088D5